MPFRSLIVAILAIPACLTAATASAQVPPPQVAPPVFPAEPLGVNPVSPNPLVGLDWYVDKDGSPAYREYRHLARTGRDGEAAQMNKIARHPQFKWWGRWAGSGNPRKAMQWWFGRLDQQQPGSVAQVVAMRHEGRECHPRYLGGGARGDANYRRWIRNFASAIGNRRVVVAFEPDSLGTVDCLARHRRKARMNTLRYGVDVLSKLPNATVYLEGGAADWEQPKLVARKLRYIGIHKVRGFMVNATHKDWTHNSVKHCREVSRLVGGKHCVINTSHNGRGPQHYRKWISRSRNLWRTINVWCNPSNEALGPAPSTVTAHPVVDAYLWIERPGFSNGTCNGGPKTGAWWKERALLLAKRAGWN